MTRSSRDSRQKRNRVIRLGSYQNDLCFFCDEPMRYLDPEIAYCGEDPSVQADDVASFDHYVPKWSGGSGRVVNTVIAHRGCNTRQGCNPKAAQYDEKLRQLNIARQYGDHEGLVGRNEMLFRLEPSAFTKPSPALIYLCDLANKVEGDDGVRLRRKLAKKIQEHILLIQSVQCLPDRGFRREVIDAVRVKRDADSGIPFDPPFSTLLDNVRSALTKKGCEN